MTGDDHGERRHRRPLRRGARRPARPAAPSPNWECVRSTSYVYASTPLTDAQAATYNAQGFEVGLHVTTDCADWTPSSLDDFYSSQLDDWHAKYPEPAGPGDEPHALHRGATTPPSRRSSSQHGIRFDTNYYYWPGSLDPGPARPVHRLRVPDALRRPRTATRSTCTRPPTQMTDESDQSYPPTINTLLDNALGPLGYYGVFTANMHTDNATPLAVVRRSSRPRSRAASRSSRPARCSTWLDGRNASSFGNVSFAGNVLSFTLTAGAGANGLQAMLPATSGIGRDADRDHAQQRAGAVHDRDPQGHRLRRVRRPRAARYTATYTADTTPPVISARHRVADDGRRDDHVDDRRAADSRVTYGTDPGSLTTVLTDSRARDRALAHDHRAHAGRDVLLPGDLDRRGRQRGDAPPPAAPASFAVPAFVATDTTRGRLHRGHARTVPRSSRTPATVRSPLAPTVGSEFTGASLPAGWTTSPWARGGSATVAGGQLTVDGTLIGDQRRLRRRAARWSSSRRSRPRRSSTSASATT